jgi:hypothetical protein
MSGRRAEAHRRIVEEIAGEKAAALGRAGERLEQALAETREAAAQLLAARNAAERDRRADEYATARRRALDARLALLIQREALGLRRHVTVDQQFPEPPSADELLRQKALSDDGLTGGRSG